MPPPGVQQQSPPPPPSAQVNQTPARVQSSRDELLAYWSHPDAANSPDKYLPPIARSQYLLRFVREYVQPTESILEIGCSSGRNLNALMQAGYRDLSGIEICQDATDLLKQHYPELGAIVKLHTAPLEEVIQNFGDRQFGLTISLAVLSTIHFDSEWIFAELARVSDKLITIEDEHHVTSRHFPRNYGEIFTRFGMSEIYSERCKGIDAPIDDFMVRVFSR